MLSIVQTQKLGIVDFVKMIYDGHPEYSLLAVKAPIDDVVQALIDLREGLTKRDRHDWRTMKYKEYRIQSRQVGWEKNITLKPYRDPDDEEYAGESETIEPGIPVLQVRGTEWTVVIRSLSWLDMDEIEDVPQEAKALSATFQTRAITLIEEDTSGAMGYELFEHGESVERFEAADDVHFKSKLRDAPENLPRSDEDEDEEYDPDEDSFDDDDMEREYNVAAEPRVTFINELFSELGIYLPAVWYDTENGRPALQVMSSSEGTIVRADWLTLKEEWTTDVEQPDDDDAA
jgi:hypothetical protein